jgi:hypothetical protein
MRLVGKAGRGSETSPVDITLSERCMQPGTEPFGMAEALQVPLVDAGP